MDYNHNMESVAETESISEDTRTKLTHSVSTTWEIEPEFQLKKKARGNQTQRSLTNFFPHKKITYKKKYCTRSALF